MIDFSVTYDELPIWQQPVAKLRWALSLLDPVSVAEQVRMASRIDSVIGERMERRRATAIACVEPLLRGLRSDGFDVVVIGSLARREFKSHSDVDFLVRGNPDSQGRAKVERAAAALCADRASRTTLSMRTT
jgi:UTP:GlnB (protein PII) uridylyltransferase